MRRRMMPKATTKKTLQAIFPFSALSLLLLILYFSIMKKLIGHWWIDPNYSHGFLIPFIAGYFVWERRGNLKEVEVKPCNWGLLLLLLGIAALLISTIGAELFIMRSSLILVIAGLILFLLGKDYFRILLFPLAFLLFMVPLPYLIYDSVAFPLKLYAAKVSTSVLHFADIPVLREGNIIVLPTTTLEVADACSGIRSLISLLALGVVYAYFTQRALWKRVVLVAATIPIAIFTNVFRLVIAGFLAHRFNPDLAEGFFHGISGWLIFIVAFMILFGLGLILTKLAPVD